MKLSSLTQMQQKEKIATKVRKINLVIKYFRIGAPALSFELIIVINLYYF